ncbi:hypothetical protein [Haloarcula halophila]|uniref:hypothetical protein n=1 Tax=Haloarcula TaxID=2237 RepID=UPI0023E38CE1|nr:hypothetical protein [Halomicroarcula sp. DFY41]
MIRRFALLLIVACSIALVPTVGAQETTSTPTPTANGTANVTAPAQAPAAELVVDDDLVVTDYRYQDGEMVITFWSSQYKAVNIAPAAGQSSAGTVSFEAAVVDADRKTTVRVASPSGVTLWTDKSIENQRFHYLRKPSTFFVSGPWSGSDVRDAGLGGAIGVAFACLYYAVAAKIGAAERGERVA